MPSTPRVAGPPRLRTCFALTTAAWILLAAAGPLWSFWSSTSGAPWIRHGVAATLVAALATAVWCARRPLYRAVTSVPFSVALLTALLAMTALGTLVLQGGAGEEYEARYGAGLAALVLGLGMDDVFHTVWFEGFLGLLALSVLLVGTRRAVWQTSMLGHMLSHLGIVVILVGGFIGKQWGFRGYIDLHEGRSVTEARVTEGGVPTGELHPLGFSLHLADFEIERREPEYRIYAYAPDGESYRRVGSLGLAEAESWTPVGSTDFELRVLATYPDFQQLSELREVPLGEGRPALELQLEGSAGSSRLHLLAGVPDRDTVRLPDGSVLVFTGAPPDDAWLASFARTSPERHVLAYQLAGEDSIEEVVMRVGETYELASFGRTLRVLEFLPDFTYDVETRSAQSRSQHPNNPAMRVAISGSDGVERERWLFSRMPDYDDGHAGEDLGLRVVYRHEPPSSPPARGTLVVAETREWWELEHGLVTRRSPLPENGAPTPGVPDATHRLFASASEAWTASTRSEQWTNPAIEVEYRSGAESTRAFLSAVHGEPVRLPGGENLLVFEPKPNDVKAYRSRLEVVQQDELVLEKTIEVNDPLAFEGYYFYQSGFREEDPTYSGILVVKDPGFFVVFAGFLMISLGLVFIYYVRPRILHKGVV